MVTDFPIQAIVDQLVERIVEIMPITAAGVTLISPGAEPRYIAASDDDALSFEQLQSDLDEGPCLTAFHSGEAVSVPDLRRETSFPIFAERALEAGLAAVFTFPLRHNQTAIGALDLYRSSPGALTARSMRDAQTLADVTSAYLINAQRRAELTAASSHANEIALHDALTGLPNRVLLMERLDRSFVRQSRAGLSTGVFFVDLDQFKVVNDTYGHLVGDQVLIAVANRLSEVLRPGDTLARVSGDEFVVLCEDLKEPVSAQAIVARLDTALSRPFTVSGIKLTVSASVGVAFMGEGGAAPDEVLHAADMAMYQAKRAGGGLPEVLDVREQPLAIYQAGLERDVYGVLERHELHLEYQPIVACRDGHICGVEALLRWDHPNRGVVAPSVLIPLAERTGMIRSIGLWVLREASAEQDHWLRDYLVTDVDISVNISAHQLMGTGFLDTVASVLAACQSSPDRLTLEMTESVFLRDGKRALVVLNELKGMGVKLALDDFGTGFSSLSYLLEFPVDIVKIDKIFIAGLGRDRANEAIVAAIINLSHDLGLTVVAEGVETAQQHETLSGLGSDACQGFYFAYPMLDANVGRLIEHRGDRQGQHLPARAAS